MKKFASVLVAAAFIGTLATPANAQTQVVVDCDAGDSLSAAVLAAGNGTTINVTGTCDESVFVPRTSTNVTIDGGEDRATVQGPDRNEPPTGPGSFTFFVEGTGLVLNNLDIVGGAHAVHLSGPASANITNNRITQSGGGIHLDKDSTAQIGGNTIVDNAGYGINIQENSYARVGFIAPTRGLMPNEISNNDGPGVVVKQWSTGWISGNQITDNAGDGVWVDRSSLGEVYDNEISGNSGSGIRATNGAGVSMSPEGQEAPSQIAGNTTTTPNTGYGVSCSVGGWVSGEQGTLTGLLGEREIFDGCQTASGSDSAEGVELSSTENPVGIIGAVIAAVIAAVSAVNFPGFDLASLLSV